MNDWIFFLIGLGVGGAGAFLVSVLSSRSIKTSLQGEMDSINAENEKLRRRYKETERQNEDFLAEIESLRKKLKSNDDDHDDLVDDIEDMKHRLKAMAAENTELKRKLSEYKTACSSMEKEIGILRR